MGRNGSKLQARRLSDASANCKRRVEGRVVSEARREGVSRSSETHLETVESFVLLSASEIGAYTYCPESWVLDRLQAPHSMPGQQRRLNGSVAHCRIGRGIDQLTLLERGVRLTGLAIILLLVVVAALSTGVVHIPQP